MVSLFVASENAAHGWVIVDGELQDDSSGPLPIALFKNFLATVTSWEQAAPLGPESVPSPDLTGYFGFLTVVQGDKTRQILLNLQDFFLSKDSTFKEGDEGRVTRAFSPVMQAIESAH
jgi:hypothetical protein